MDGRTAPGLRPPLCPHHVPTTVSPPRAFARWRARRHKCNAALARGGEGQPGRTRSGQLRASRLRLAAGRRRPGSPGTLRARARPCREGPRAHASTSRDTPARAGQRRLVQCVTPRTPTPPARPGAEGQLGRDAVLRPARRPGMTADDPPPRASAREAPKRDAGGEKRVVGRRGGLSLRAVKGQGGQSTGKCRRGSHTRVTK